jgi:hypothetical protein
MSRQQIFYNARPFLKALKLSRFTVMRCLLSTALKSPIGGNLCIVHAPLSALFFAIASFKSPNRILYVHERMNEWWVNHSTLNLYANIKIARHQIFCIARLLKVSRYTVMRCLLSTALKSPIRWTVCLLLCMPPCFFYTVYMYSFYINT